MARRGVLEVVDVLVVDDDEAVRSSLAEILRWNGMSTAEAVDGLDALAHLETSQVGVVVLDVRMPRLGGLQLLDRLDDPPPVVLVTGELRDEEINARESKIASFLKKPVAPLELVATVGRCLRTKKRSDPASP
jgi:CheY-like chemotaxis protein